MNIILIGFVLWIFLGFVGLVIAYKTFYPLEKPSIQKLFSETEWGTFIGFGLLTFIGSIMFALKEYKKIKRYKYFRERLKLL